jgi:plasmid segregation protein ParM
VGQAGVTWIHQGQQHIFEYETENALYSVGAVDGAPTHFEGYPWSGLNRAIAQHALQQAGLAGRTVHAVSGLPVSAFYRKNGEHRQDTIAKKRESLKQAVRPKSATSPAGIAFHEVIPEALAAWYDHVIVEKEGRAVLDDKHVAVPIAIVDIGGRTTDYVVVKDQGILHASSGSLQCGMLDVKQSVENGIQERFDQETLSEQIVSHAVEHGVVRLHGKEYGVGALVDAAKQEVVERLHAETRRHLGLGVELDRVLFVGGGTVALAEYIANWFPHQAIAEHPAFANARGMLKYLRYVCEASDAA